MTAMDGMHASDDNKSAFCYNAKGKLIHRETVILNGPRSPLTITPKNEEPETEFDECCGHKSGFLPVYQIKKTGQRKNFCPAYNGG